MLLQSDFVMPPPEPVPNFEILAKKAAAERVENKWFTIPASRIVHGFSESNSDSMHRRFFVWDNETPRYQVHVAAFEAQARPVNNGEYAKYLSVTGREIPVLWTSKTTQVSAEEVDESAKLRVFLDNNFIKTVYGPISLHIASDWPVMASYNELAGYARWVGCRIPTLSEVRSIYDIVETQKRVKDGSERANPDSMAPETDENFVNLTDCNIGLQHFHPMPVTQNGNRLSGLGDMGGAWEWTSSLLEPYEGFRPMDIYPGYTGIVSRTLRTLSLC